ncbi:MAG TPA: adenylate/guanylate cyclase domain-containing protein [Candidatus Dormibacteraeota bacterium]|jgi:adenylate cyclase|nr:adenylate/guanylate cyclase domain-containing protein [Candidatus Dormibacteraeota bacterium]
MAASSANWWKGRGGFGVYELLLSWWRHRVSFLLSLCITVFALGIYYLVFLQEKRTPISEFAQRLELNTLDTRFRFRPLQSTHPDPRIVIVDIDQQAQEVLGRWPFSRAYFAKMLDVLHDDHAAAAAFDITFSKPDQSAAPLRSLQSSLEKREQTGEPIDPKLLNEVSGLIREYDADAQFAASIKRFGPVVLGNYFLFTQADLQGLSEETLAAYADRISFFAYPPAHAVRTQFAKQDKLNLMEDFSGAKLLPRGAEANLDTLTATLSGDTSWTGFFNAPPDNDGVVRRATLVLPYGRSQNPEDWDIYPSLGLMSSRALLGHDALDTNLFYGPIGITTIELGSKTVVHPDGRGQLMINFQGPWGTFHHYSIVDVLNKKFEPGTFQGKLVLIGATATGIGDLRATPFGGTNYPGVEIHANIVDNILNDRFLKRGSQQALIDALLIFSFGIPLGIWMALAAPRWMWFGIALLPLLVLVDYAAFLHGWWLNFTMPAMTLTGNVVLVSLYRALVEEKEKRRIRSEFGQYLPPEVVRRLLLNPQLVDPRKTEITIMFSDIRGFTTISEKLDAQDLATFLNLYLSDMTRIVFNRQGTLDKYIGDAVMAFWGAPFEEPGHADRACQSALDMMRRVGELQKQWEAEGKPRMDIGIGLNTGVASVGRMGSSSRYAYTALGDAVNLSSRLEGLNKDYGTHILANESTYEASKNSGLLFRELDLIRVKGKLQPVTIHELIGREADASPETIELLTQFTAARSLYQARKWQDAQNAFQSILEKWPTDGPSRTYWKRCQEYLFDEPPLNWDGVFTMDHK